MPEDRDRNTPNPRNSLCVVGAELLLILLPFLVIAIALGQRDELSSIIYMPAWGVAASTLIGLSMVRLASGLLHGGEQMEKLAWERVLLLFAAIVAFAFVPSLLVLALILLSKSPSGSLATLQLLLFFVGLVLFIALGWAGEYVISEADGRNHGRQELTIVNSRAAGD